MIQNYHIITKNFEILYDGIKMHFYNIQNYDHVKIPYSSIISIVCPIIMEIYFLFCYASDFFKILDIRIGRLIGELN